MRFGSSLLVVIGYLTVNLVAGTFVAPGPVGREKELFTLAVYLIDPLGNYFWHVGMVLCVPIAMTLKCALKQMSKRAGLACCQGGGRPPPA